MADELKPYGFRGIGEDSDLLLRCCAAIIAKDASPNTIINLKGADVRTRFKEVRSGILGAIDFLRTHLLIHSTEVLPYMQIIVPLSVFFATDKDQSTNPNAEQTKTLIRWIWRTFFTRRYSKRLEQLNQDVLEVSNLKTGEPNHLGTFVAEVTKEFFLTNSFSLRNVNTKTFILMLASERPRDFIGGGYIALGEVLRECNKKEFHHIYPRAFLKELKIEDNEIDCLANITILPRASNNKIGGQKPSEYKVLMPGDRASSDAIERSAFLPNNWQDDNFAQFIQARAGLLVQKSKALMEL